MAAPDYETPADQGGDNTYNVTVIVEDDEGMSATLPVTITVTNVDEDGTVTIAGMLFEGEELTAAVTDIDGAVSDLTCSGRGEHGQRVLLRHRYRDLRRLHVGGRGRG